MSESQYLLQVQHLKTRVIKMNLRTDISHCLLWKEQNHCVRSLKTLTEAAAS